MTRGPLYIDEDVQISLTFPKGELITIQDFPTFDNDVKGFLLNDCDMHEIFGISSTSSYMDFNESRNNNFRHATNSIPTSFLGTTPDYDGAYTQELEDVFEYSVYEEDDGKQVIKLTFDYIKHHTVIAFPTVIFLKEGKKTIPYSITSKNNADILEGVIELN